MSQAQSINHADYLVAVDMGDAVFGTLAVEKTEINIPVNGVHYVVLAPTSRVLKSKVAVDGVQSIGYKTLLEELVDINDEDESIQRELIIRGSNSSPIYFTCRKEFSNIKTSSGKKLVLLSPESQVPSDISSMIANSVNQNY